VAQQHGALRRLQAVWRKTVALAGGIGKMLEQHQNIVAAFTQWRDTQRGDVQAVVKVGAEAALVGGLAQVFLGGSDHADI